MRPARHSTCPPRPRIPGLCTTLLLALALITPGCLKMEHELRLERDGSVIYKLDYEISEQAITQFAAARRIVTDVAAIQDAPSPSPQHPILIAFQNPREAAIRTAIERYSQAGLSIKKLQVDTRNAWRRVQLEVTCNDLTALSKTDFFQLHGFELSRSDGHYTFWRRAHLAPAEASAAPMDQQTIRQVTPLLEGFKTDVRLVVPGKILRSTAFKTIRGIATWSFAFDEDPEALRALQHQPFRVEFETAKSLPEVSYAGRNYVSISD